MSRTVKHAFTWDEYVDRAKDAVAKFPGERTSGRGSWSGGSFEEAVEMATVTGYKAAVVEVEQIVQQIDQLVTSDAYRVTFDTVFDVSGGEVDMGRFLSGEPECMRESFPVKVAARGRAVRLTVNTGYLGAVEEYEVRRRGAAILALVDILARLQHPMEIWTARVAEVGSVRLLYTVKVQDANQPLDMGRVMYAIAHPSYHRQLCFRNMAHDGRQYGFGSSKGGSTDIYEHELDEYPSGTAIVLNESIKPGETWDIDRSVAWIHKQLDLIFADHR